MAVSKKEKRLEKDLIFFQSWGDMVALLMVFFVFLYSMSTLDASKFRESASSLTSIFKFKNKNEMLNKYIEEERILMTLLEELNKYVFDKKLNNEVNVFIENHKLVMDLGSSVLFEIAETSLKSSAEGILKAFVSYLIKVENANIVVEGHTDDRPINTSDFPSNWELSASRAASVVRFFAKQGIKEENCYIIGYSQYKPIFENNSEDNRSKNRRVRIIFTPIVKDVINNFDENNLKDVSK